MFGTWNTTSSGISTVHQ